MLIEKATATPSANLHLRQYFWKRIQQPSLYVDALGQFSQDDREHVWRYLMHEPGYGSYAATTVQISDHYHWLLTPFQMFLKHTIYEVERKAVTLHQTSLLTGGTGLHKVMQITFNNLLSLHKEVGPLSLLQNFGGGLSLNPICFVLNSVQREVTGRAAEPLILLKQLIECYLIFIWLYISNMKEVSWP